MTDKPMKFYVELSKAEIHLILLIMANVRQIAVPANLVTELMLDGGLVGLLKKLANVHDNACNGHQLLPLILKMAEMLDDPFIEMSPETRENVRVALATKDIDALEKLIGVPGTDRKPLHAFRRPFIVDPESPVWCPSCGLHFRTGTTTTEGDVQMCWNCGQLSIYADSALGFLTPITPDDMDGWSDIILQVIDIAQQSIYERGRIA